MHTVAMTHAFVRAAKIAGLTSDEVDEIVRTLAENPMAGDELQGTGGCRKVRFAGRGKGKSGGFRTITFYTGDRRPVFLLTVFAKGEKANLSASERDALRGISKNIAAEYQANVESKAKKGG